MEDGRLETVEFYKVSKLKILKLYYVNRKLSLREDSNVVVELLDLVA